jgi:3-hydroxyisobutyrate dehydrogenase
MASMSKEIGFIGLGNMGHPMSGRLIAQGYAVHVYDLSAGALERSAAAGGHAHASPRAVADTVECLCLSLPASAAVEAVLLGENGVAGGKRVKRVIDFSTIGPRAAGAMAKALAESGIEYIDAPVSGGVGGAIKGTVSIMAACRRQTYDDLLGMFKGLGNPFYVGSQPGHGQIVKIGNNLLSMTAMAVTSEIMVMGAKAGIDPALMLEVINVSSGRNTATMDKFPRSVLPGTFDYGFTTGLAYKDVKLCVDEAEGMGVPMVAGAAVRQLYAVTQATQGADSDFTSVCKVLESWGGAQVRARKP